MSTLMVVLVAFLLVSAGVAGAQPAAPAVGSKQATVRNVSGTVKSTSADAVVVAGRDKGKDIEWTFGVEPTTDIRKGTKSIMAADLKPGESVQVRFTQQDGKAVARSILVRGKGGTAEKKTKP